MTPKHTLLIRFPSITAFSIDRTGATIYLIGTVGKQRGLFERKL